MTAQQGSSKSPKSAGHSRYERAPSMGPLGTKGAGEVPILNVAAAIACAVANATEKRVQELPLTPPRVLELLLDRKRDLTLSHIAGT